MSRRYRLAAIGLLSLGLVLILGASPGMAQSRAHVYLFRGLADVFSLGMDTLTDELNNQGVAATVHSHTDWKPIADKAAENYKAGKEGPIILIGHSLGADAVMEMADYLGDKGVPVALVVPFDATQSWPAPGNVARVVNLTQRDYAYMRAGPGFRGSLNNVDVSSDREIDHLNIDKSPRLHAKVIAEVLAIVGGRRPAAPMARKPAAPGEGSAKSHEPTAPAKLGERAKATEQVKPLADSGPPVTAPPEAHEATTSPAVTGTLPPPRPRAAPHPVSAVEIPD